MRIPKFFQIAALIMLAAGAQPAYSAFWQWSMTASNNANADPSINWAEGMSPSSVNDSARAMMARAAEWRDDISGKLITGGTSTAYTLTTNEGFPSPPANATMLAFRMNTTNGNNATLAVDGGTAYPIQSELGVALASGSLIGGNSYRASFTGSSWVLEATYNNPYSIPLGGILWSTLSTAPNSAFVAPSGQCISTTTYAAYWAAMGSPASGACPGGQFQLIDMRGYTVAALDTLNASAANRMTSSSAGCGTAFTTVGAICANGNQSQTLTVAQLAAHTHVNTLTDPQHTHTTSNGIIDTVINGTGGALAALRMNVGGGITILNSSSTGITITNASAGGGAAHPVVQPTIGLVPYLRIL